MHTDKDGNCIDACVAMLQWQDGEELHMWACTSLKMQRRECEILQRLT